MSRMGMAREQIATVASAASVTLGPDSRVAFDLAHAALSGRPIIFVDSSDSRLARLERLVAIFAPDVEVLVLPAWDSLPYDRTPPSPRVIGQRVHGLSRLAEARTLKRLVLTSARALLQLVPPP